MKKVIFTWIAVGVTLFGLLTASLCGPFGKTEPLSKILIVYFFSIILGIWIIVRGKFVLRK